MLIVPLERVGRPILPGLARRLVVLVGKVRLDLGHADRNLADALRRDLRQPRSRFEFEARGEAGQTVL